MKTCERDRVREIWKKIPQDVYVGYIDLIKIKIFFSFVLSVFLNTAQLICIDFVLERNFLFGISLLGLIALYILGNFGISVIFTHSWSDFFIYHFMGAVGFFILASVVIFDG